MLTFLDAGHRRALERDRLHLRVDLPKRRLELVANLLAALLEAVDRGGQLRICDVGPTFNVGDARL